jgi:hypothetical protein
VAQEMGRLRDGILQRDAEIQPVLWALLSSIAVKASFRESDTSNHRQPHHRPPGTTAILFHKKARELGRMLEGLPEHEPVSLSLADARERPPPSGTGIVLTSPPYPGVYDYLPMQQLRQAWLNLEPGQSLAKEIGSRRSFRARGRKAALRLWREDTMRWIARQREGLGIGGRMVIVVGDGLVGGRMVDALSITMEAMRSAGMDIVARVSGDRTDHARNTVRTEHIVMAELCR